MPDDQGLLEKCRLWVHTQVCPAMLFERLQKGAAIGYIQSG